MSEWSQFQDIFGHGLYLMVKLIVYYRSECFGREMYDVKQAKIF